MFLFNFFKDSVADAAEWRVLNGFVEEVKAKGQVRLARAPPARAHSTRRSLRAARRRREGLSSPSCIAAYRARGAAG